MKFIELHDERNTFWVNTDSIGMIETATITTRPSISKISSYIYVHGIGRYCIETVEEILQKIAEAEAERERKDGDAK